MIDFKNKKVIWISVGVVAGIAIITTAILLLVHQSNIKKAEQTEKERIAQEEKARLEMDALKIAAAPAEEENTADETPNATQSTAATSSATTTTVAPAPAPTPTPTPTPDPTPAPDPRALTITAKYDETNITPDLLTYGEFNGYFLVDPIDTIIRLDFQDVAGTTVVATVESGGYWFVKVSDTKYKFIEGGNGIVRIDLIDGDGNIVKTGKCKLTTPRG